MLVRQTLKYLPAQVVGPLAQVTAAIVWTHWLEPAPYGVLTLLIAAQDLVFLLCLSWWTQFTLRYLDGLSGARRVGFARGEASVLALALAAASAVACLVVRMLHQPTTTAVAAVAFIATRSLVTHLGERARAQSRIGVYTLGQMCCHGAGFALAYALVRFEARSGQPSTLAAVLGGFSAAQAVGAVLMWRRLGVTGGDWLPGGGLLSAALVYGAPLLVAGAAAWVAQNGIRLVVERLAGAAELGLVAVGWGLGQRLAATLAMLVIAASFPLAVRRLDGGSRADGFRQLSLGGVMLMALVVPASVGLCLLAEPFVTLFVAAPFREATIAVLPLAAAAGAVRNIRMHLADPVFLLIERPGITTAINAVDAITTLAGCAAGLALGVRYGGADGALVGAVAGCLAGGAASFAAGFALAQHLAGFSFPARDAAKVALASSAMAAALLIAPWARLAPHPLARMALEAGTGLIVYAAAMAALYPALARSAVRRLNSAYRVGMGVPLR